MYGELLRSKLVERDEVDVVGIASDGVEALELARELEPDVLLMDAGMPRADGIEATRRASHLPRPPRIMLMTSGESPAADQRTFTAGASAYLKKSNDLLQLMDVVVAMAHVSAPI